MKSVWQYEIINKERFQLAKSVIIASNHISWFDPPFIGAVVPFEICYLAKAELFKNKIIGKYLSVINVIPYVRGTADMKAISTVLTILNSGRSLLMFPEGTRKGKNIKPGVGLFAMKTQRDILPVYIENSDKLLSCFFSRTKKIKIVLGEPISYDYFATWEQTKENYQKLADYTYSKIKELKHAD